MSAAPDEPVRSTPGTSALPLPAAPATRTATDVALVATFAAFIVVCVLLPEISTGFGVPITLQTFGVILAGLVLGPLRGFLAVLLYLVLGFAGLPVFADGRSGLAVLAGLSVGYLLAFPFAAALAGWFGRLARRVRPALRYPALFAAGFGASVLVIHPAGVLGLVLRGGLSVGEAVRADLVFWPGDVLKNLAAALVTLAVLRTFPELLRSRR